MLAHCDEGTYVYAWLETQEHLTTATDGTCRPDFDLNYGINYYYKAD